MKIWRTRPAGVQISVLACICSLAIAFFATSCEETPRSRRSLDTRWTQFAQHHYRPLYAHELRGQRVGGLIAAFNNDRSMLAYSNVSRSPRQGSESRGTAIDVIRVDSGQVVSRLDGHSRSTQSMAFTRDGLNLVSCGECEIKIWDIAESTEISRANAQQGFIRCIACSPAGDVAASGGDDGTILIWGLKPLQVSKQLVGHRGGVRCLKWSADGTSILSGSWDGSIRLWDVSSGTSRFTGQTDYGRVMSLDLSHDGRFALSTYLNGPDQPVVLWNTERKAQMFTFGIPGNPWHADQQLHIAAVAFSPDGQSALLGAAFGSVIWWDVKRWKQIDHCRTHQEELVHVVFSADGRQAISIGGGDSDAVPDVRVWELPDLSEVKTDAPSHDGPQQ